MTNDDSLNEESVSQRADELVQMAERQAGEQAIRKVVQHHFDQVLALRESHPLDNEDLLSKAIEKNGSLHNEVTREVARLHAKMRTIIEGVTSEIESQGYKDKAAALDAMKLGYNERARAGALLEADRKRVVSFRTLNIAVGVMSDLNQMLVEKAQVPSGAKIERDLLFLNALLVYEVNDFVIDFIENFQLGAAHEIDRLHSESVQRIAQNREELDRLTEQANSPEVAVSARQATLSDVAHRRRAIDRVEKGWNHYLSQSEELMQELKGIKRSLPTLKLIRGSAKSQLNVLEAVTVVQIVGSSLGALNEALKVSSELHIIPLNEERIQRLTGI